MDNGQFLLKIRQFAISLSTVRCPLHTRLWALRHRFLALQSAAMLHTLKPAFGSVRKRKRVARGNSAGGGTTAGRGTKGQQSRVGKTRKFGFEGGQVPLLMRQPKLGGFAPPRQVSYEVVNVETLEEVLDAGSYDVAALRSRRIVRTKNPVKLLGMGSLTKKFTIEVHAASKSAKEAVKKAGGEVILVK